MWKTEKQIFKNNATSGKPLCNCWLAHVHLDNFVNALPQDSNVLFYKINLEPAGHMVVVMSAEIL